MKIYGGTHLGIVGCYMERTLPNGMTDNEINTLLLQEYEQGKLPAYKLNRSVKLESYKTSDGGLVHTIVDSNGDTMFEWCHKR